MTHNSYNSYTYPLIISGRPDGLHQKAVESIPEAAPTLHPEIFTIFAVLKDILLVLSVMGDGKGNGKTHRNE